MPSQGQMQISAISQADGQRQEIVSGALELTK